MALRCFATSEDVSAGFKVGSERISLKTGPNLVFRKYSVLISIVFNGTLILVLKLASPTKRTELRTDSCRREHVIRTLQGRLPPGVELFPAVHTPRKDQQPLGAQAALSPARGATALEERDGAGQGGRAEQGCRVAAVVVAA